MRTCQAGSVGPARAAPPASARPASARRGSPPRSARRLARAPRPLSRRARRPPPSPHPARGAAAPRPPHSPAAREAPSASPRTAPPPRPSPEHAAFPQPPRRGEAPHPGSSSRTPWRFPQLEPRSLTRTQQALRCSRPGDSEARQRVHDTVARAVKGHRGGGGGSRGGEHARTHARTLLGAVSAPRARPGRSGARAAAPPHPRPSRRLQPRRPAAAASSQPGRPGRGRGAAPALSRRVCPGTARGGGVGAGRGAHPRGGRARRVRPAGAGWRLRARPGLSRGRGPCGLRSGVWTLVRSRSAPPRVPTAPSRVTLRLAHPPSAPGGAESRSGSRGVAPPGKGSGLPGQVAGSGWKRCPREPWPHPHKNYARARVCRGHSRLRSLGGKEGLRWRCVVVTLWC